MRKEHVLLLPSIGTQHGRTAVPGYNCTCTGTYTVTATLGTWYWVHLAVLNLNYGCWGGALDELFLDFRAL
eukprot:SAG31_NODE_5746_length_2348_cov_1.336739_3_plen_71_part_00